MSESQRMAAAHTPGSPLLRHNLSRCVLLDRCSPGYVKARRGPPLTRFESIGNGFSVSRLEHHQGRYRAT